MLRPVATAATLPHDVMELIARHFTPAARARLGFVSRSWASTALTTTTTREIAALVHGERADHATLNVLVALQRCCASSDAAGIVVHSVQCAVARLDCAEPPAPMASERSWLAHRDALVDAVRRCPVVRRAMLDRAAAPCADADSLYPNCDWHLFKELLLCGTDVDRTRARRDAAAALTRTTVDFRRQPWHRIVFLLRGAAAGPDDLTDSVVWVELCRMMRERMSLEGEQATAFCTALSGRNCFITGAGGCGKSHVAQLVQDALKSAGHDVAVLAPTRLAARRIDGLTYHSWAGLRPRKIASAFVRHPSFFEPTPEETAKELRRTEEGADEEEDTGEEVEQLPLDTAFVPVRSKWTRERVEGVSVVMLDEVSFVSEFNFKCLKTVVDAYADADVQWILLGDFCQLPCIFRPRSVESAALASGTTCKYLFQSTEWRGLQLASVLLRVNRRSCANVRFCRALERARLGHRMCDGQPIAEVIGACCQSDRATAPQFGIFGRKKQKQAYNEKRFAALQAEELPLVAIDRTDAKGRRCTKLPRVVTVKVGASLRVTRGVLRDQIGTLLRVETGVLALRTETGAEICVRMLTEQSGDALRTQYPVEICFGLTAHKSQGRSMQSLLVDCGADNEQESFWEDGQAYVAISRATDPSLLQVDNIHRLRFRCAPEVRALYAGLAR